MSMKRFWSVEHDRGFCFSPLRAAQLVLLIGFAFSCSGCASQQSEVLRERCAQLANRGYSDRAEVVELLRAAGQAVPVDGQSLRRAAKNYCATHG